MKITFVDYINILIIIASLILVIALGLNYEDDKIILEILKGMSAVLGAGYIIQTLRIIKTKNIQTSNIIFRPTIIQKNKCP
jgi:hypothetical protein